MNVLLILTYGISLKIWEETGLLNREVTLYERLGNDHNIQFTFLTFGDEEDLKYKNKYNNIDIFPIYSKYKYHKNKLLRFFYSFVICFKIKNDFKNIEIIKTNQLMGSWMAIILKQLIGCPLIIRTGFNILEFSIRNRKGLHKIIFYYFLTQISINFSNYFLVTSNADRQFINKYFIKTKKKVLVRQNWVISQNNSKPFNQREDNKILAVGRLESQKNFKYLINELKGTNISLDIVGDGSLKNELELLAKNLEVKVSFIDPMPNNQLIQFMSNYKIFVLPSLFEGNPKALSEAMSQGCVPFVSNIKNNKELVVDKENGLIFKCEKNNLKNLLTNSIKNTHLLQRLSKKSIDHMRDNFSLDSYLLQEFEDYKLLLVS